jgi:hypothetical protein
MTERDAAAQEAFAFVFSAFTDHSLPYDLKDLLTAVQTVCESDNTNEIVNALDDIFNVSREIAFSRIEKILRDERTKAYVEMTDVRVQAQGGQ